jgi:hypothetical protein
MKSFEFEIPNQIQSIFHGVAKIEEQNLWRKASCRRR